MIRQKKPTYGIYFFIRNTSFIIFKLFFKFEIEGKENIPSSGSFIVASNHASYLDPPIVGATFTRMLHFMARENLFEAKFVGNIIKRVGAIPLRRHYQDLRAIKTLLKMLKEGEPIAMFPEGTRSEDSGLGKPELGIGMIAAHSGAPVIPVFIDGSGDVLPKHSKFIKSLKHIKVYLGSALKFEEPKGSIKKKESYELFTNKVMASIEHLKELHETKS